MVNVNYRVNRQFFLNILFGNPPHRRRRYFLVAVGITLVVWTLGIVGDLEPWFRSHLWQAALIGSSIGILAGWDNQGIAAGYLGSGLYITLIWQRFYTLSTGVDYPLLVILPRQVMVLGTMTAILTVPSYLFGVSVRLITTRWDRMTTSMNG